jgi:hypothetical protein
VAEPALSAAISRVASPRHRAIVVGPVSGASEAVVVESGAVAAVEAAVAAAAVAAGGVDDDDLLPAFKT